MREGLYRLEDFGCTVVEQPIMHDGLDTPQPFVAILKKSEVPTEEEVVVISKLIIQLARSHGARPGAAGDRGAPTVTLRKNNGQWSFVQAPLKAKITWKPLPGLAQLLQP